MNFTPIFVIIKKKTFLVQCGPRKVIFFQIQESFRNQNLFFNRTFCVLFYFWTVLFVHRFQENGNKKSKIFRFEKFKLSLFGAFYLHRITMNMPHALNVLKILSLRQRRHINDPVN